MSCLRVRLVKSSDGNSGSLRNKDVIIRGGQNIQPAEIEGLLMEYPKIEDVAVVPMPDPIMGEKACAYVVPANHRCFF